MGDDHLSSKYIGRYIAASPLTTFKPVQANKLNMLSLGLLLAAVLAVLSARAKEIYSSCGRDGDIAFTYDQGPSLHTGRLLSALSRASVKATFHVVPDYLDNPILRAYLKKTATDGHLIGLYVSAATPSNSAGAEADILKWIDRAQAAIAKHINYRPQFLRFPNDAAPSGSLLAALHAQGLTVTTYNLDSQDYHFVNDTATDGKGAIYEGVRSVLEALEPSVRGSFVMVQRDLVGPSVDQAAAIFALAKDKGYKAVRLDECIGSTVSAAKPGDSSGNAKKRGDDNGGKVGEMDVANSGFLSATPSAAACLLAMLPVVGLLFL